MIDWDQQPSDVANVYNPAFIGELLRLCAETYVQEHDQGFPLILAYVALPLLLFKDSRQSLVTKRYKTFRAWLDHHPEVRVTLGERARALHPFVRLAVVFAVQHRALTLNAEGLLEPLPRPRTAAPLVKRLKASEHSSPAQHLGRLLAQGGQLHNVFIALGVRP